MHGAARAAKLERDPTSGLAVGDKSAELVFTFGGHGPGEPPLTNPTTGIGGCCARAASGHAAAPPRKAMCGTCDQGRERVKSE